jgi:predicted AlkP superfamily phosphohydrolase/phosphomutase
MKTLIVGLDAFDPTLFENLYGQGKLPNLGRYVENGGYSRFQVSNPPQSEVSWTSIATGLNPGEHGMFDFVHRDPEKYNLIVSLLPTGRSLGGLQFVRPYNARTIFDVAAERGYPSTSLWWPATFPARPESPVRTLPGLGTPDIQGRLGVGSFYSSDRGYPGKLGKTPVFRLESRGEGRYTAELEGPRVKSGQGMKIASLPIEVIVKDLTSAEIKIEKQTFRLKLAEWSPIIQIRFKASWLASVHAITRLVITRLEPHVEFYVLPLQIHPLHPLWRYGTPASFVRAAWESSGPFLTLGWPQDTTGLEDGCINDEQFLQLCNTIFNARAGLLFHLLDSFQEGLLASVFDSLDRIQHMFWRRRPDVIESWYQRLDRLIGEIEERLLARPGQETRLLIVSDHGFNNLDYKVHLNRWLVDNGYLTLRIAGDPAGDPAGDHGVHSDLKSADWAQSQAYAIGLNSLYLNLKGREGLGCVLAEERQPLIDRLQADLLAWRGPDNRPVIQNAWLNEQVFNGTHASLGPDMLIGYTPGYRASAETGLGAWKNEAIESNHDHWEADHCFDSSSVPGVLFSSRSLKDYAFPSYRDFPALSIDASPDATGAAPPPKLASEDQEKIEERLKSLGYL